MVAEHLHVDLETEGQGLAPIQFPTTSCRAGMGSYTGGPLPLLALALGIQSCRKSPPPLRASSEDSRPQQQDCLQLVTPFWLPQPEP